MSQAETDICNLALLKLGGAGDALNGNALINSIDGTDKVSSFCKLAFPRVRRRVTSDLATSDAPFRSTIRFKDLDAQLSDTPEIGNWCFAFNLPGDCLVVVCQFDEDHIATRNQKSDYISEQVNIKYQWETIANSAGTGKIFLTNTLSNSDQNGAFIEYVIDTPNANSFSEPMIDCIATLLASEIAPIVGKDIETSEGMLVKYLQVAFPTAKKENLYGYNFSARPIGNYRGGRSSVFPVFPENRRRR